MTNVSIRIDDELKRELDEICDAMGMNLTTLFTVYAKKVVRDRAIPFELSAPKDPFYSESNMKRIAESVDQANSGKLHTMTLEEFEQYGNS